MDPTRSARVALDLLTPHPRNVREGDVGAIVESLRAFGQYRPIVVQSRGDGEPWPILAGTHTWRAHQALAEEDPERWGMIDVVPLDVDDETALRIMVADNRTHDLGTYREADLADLLAELAKDGTLPGTGYDRDDVDGLLRDLGRLDPGAFLRGHIDPDARDPLAPDVALTGDAADAGTDPGSFVTVAFTMLPAERDRIMDAVREAQRRNEEKALTQPQALLLIVAEWRE